MSLQLFRVRALRRVGKLIAAKLRYDLIARSRITPLPPMVRLGGGSGAWTIPDKILNESSVCYCIGCGEDISFDLELINRFGCKVHAFDPTERAVRHVRQAADGVEKYLFQDIGLWDEDTTLRFFAPADGSHVSHSALNLQKTDSYFEATARRLSGILRDNEHTHIDLLKIDIEGAEYNVIDSVVEDGIPIRILCVEFDECFNPLDSHYRSRIGRSIAQIGSAGYRLAHGTGDGNLTFVQNDTFTD